jgi:hypothetical protein
MNIPEARLAIRYRRTDHLEPDPRTPRRHSRKQIKQLARSSETYRFAVPALRGPTLNRSQELLDGFARHPEDSRTLACAMEVADAA